MLCGCAAQRELKPRRSVVVAAVSKVESPLLRMCCSPLEQKWNSTSVIIEQQGAKEVFGLGRRNKREVWAKMCVQGEKLRNGNNTQNPLCLCLLYSKGNRQGYTVNEMINNTEGYILEKRMTW